MLVQTLYGNVTSDVVEYCLVDACLIGANLPSEIRHSTELRPSTIEHHNMASCRFHLALHVKGGPNRLQMHNRRTGPKFLKYYPIHLFYPLTDCTHIAPTNLKSRPLMYPLTPQGAQISLNTVWNVQILKKKEWKKKKLTSDSRIFPTSTFKCIKICSILTDACVRLNSL